MPRRPPDKRKLRQAVKLTRSRPLKLPTNEINGPKSQLGSVDQPTRVGGAGNLGVTGHRALVVRRL